MTGHYFASLSCDGCGAVFDDRRSLTIPHARTAARTEGWKRPSRALDQCPACAQNLPAPTVKLSARELGVLGAVIDQMDTTAVNANTLRSLEAKGYIARQHLETKAFNSTKEGRARYRTDLLKRSESEHP